MASIDSLCQIILAFTGATSLYLMASQEARWRMWGAIAGLSGEPFWLTTAIINEQPGIIFLCILYGASWCRVALTNWRAYAVMK